MFAVHTQVRPWHLFAVARTADCRFTLTTDNVKAAQAGLTAPYTSVITIAGSIVTRIGETPACSNLLVAHQMIEDDAKAVDVRTRWDPTVPAGVGESASAQAFPKVVSTEPPTAPAAA
jgi:hypothetical protein